MTARSRDRSLRVGRSLLAPSSSAGRAELRRRVAVVVAAGALTLGGCTAPAVDLAADAGARLQEAVWSVTSAAAQGRLDAAVEALERVRSELDAAVEDGDISVQRYREVDQALRAVDAELAGRRAAEAAAAEPAEEPPAEAAPPPEAPSDPAAVAPPLPVAPAPTDPGPAEGQGGERPDDRGGAGNQGNGVGPDGNRGRGQGRGRAPDLGRPGRPG